MPSVHDNEQLNDRFDLLARRGGRRMSAFGRKLPFRVRLEPMATEVAALVELVGRSL